MKILIIGGTKFVGRHLIRAAVDNGHDVTIFHRGRNAPSDLPKVNEILGDRNHDLDKLSNTNWDAVIDTCGYLPQQVVDSCEALKNSTGLYVYISSISAYAGFSEPDFDETAPLASLSPKQEAALRKFDLTADINAYGLGEMYGGLKALCEEAVTRVFPQNSLIIRPGLIVGEYDWTDRFTYWVMRVAEGGDIFAPGSADSHAQFIDAVDIAEWMIRLVENSETGTFNAAGKPYSVKFGAMLSEMKSALGSDARFVWGDDDFMSRHDVAPWTDMPVYLPDTDETKGFSTANVDRAIEKGLTFTDLKDTVLTVHEWRRKMPEAIKAGISRERERALLKAFQEQTGKAQRKSQ